MFSLFGKKTAGWVGVDIGSSSVKLVALSQSNGKYQLDAYAIASLPQTAVVDGTIENIGQVSETIERALKVCGVKLTQAVTAVPSSAVITKKLEISSVFAGVELEEQIRIEGDQVIPYALNEVALDFEVEGPVDGHENLNRVLLVACRKEDVTKREDAINSTPLNCGIVDVDTFAMERLLPLLGEEDPNAMVGFADIGASTLTLNVFRNRELVYNREQAFGGNELTNAIQAQYGIEVSEVEQKLRSGDIDDEIHQMLVLPFRQSVIQQVSRALQFFYSSGIRSQLSRLYIAGGTSGIEGLEQMLGDEVGIDTRTLNPFINLELGPRINAERLNKEAPMLAKACGLALRSFDQ